MTSLKNLVTYKYDFGSLFYEPDSRGDEATSPLLATRRVSSFFSQEVMMVWWIDYYMDKEKP